MRLDFVFKELLNKIIVWFYKFDHQKGSGYMPCEQQVCGSGYKERRVLSTTINQRQSVSAPALSAAKARSVLPPRSLALLRNASHVSSSFSEVYSRLGACLF